MPDHETNNATTGLNGIQVRNLARNFKEQIIDKLTKPNSKISEQDLLTVWNGQIDFSNYSREKAGTKEHFKTFDSYYRFMGQIFDDHPPYCPSIKHHMMGNMTYVDKYVRIQHLLNPRRKNTQDLKEAAFDTGTIDLRDYISGSKSANKI